MTTDEYMSMYRIDRTVWFGEMYNLTPAERKSVEERREARLSHNDFKLRPGEMSLMDHAEYWARENGLDVPEDRDSNEYTVMYEKWIDFAFAGFAKLKDDEEEN